MNDNKFCGSEKTLRLSSQVNNDDNTSTSHYALKLALQTMKERCQKLQKRLTCLEDENLQLRIERHSVPALVEKEPKTDISLLTKQVEELSRQKSLLCHHIYMVATENKDLWERLSQVTDDKEMREIKIQALADSSNKSIMKPDKSIEIIESCKNSGIKEDSLEEISLRILSSLNKTKISEDNKNFETDTGGGELSVRECEFTLEIEEEVVDSVEEGRGRSGAAAGSEATSPAAATGGGFQGGALLTDMCQIVDKLKAEKTLLKQQQEGLKAAVNVVNHFLKEKQSCKNCATLEEELDKERSNRRYANSSNKNRSSEDSPVDSNLRPEPNFNIPKSKDTFEDRICPLCAKFYSKSTPFDEFNEHVLSHFVEEPEQDSLMSNYELSIT